MPSPKGARQVTLTAAALEPAAVQYGAAVEPVDDEPAQGSAFKERTRASPSATRRAAEPAAGDVEAGTAKVVGKDWHLKVEVDTPRRQEQYQSDLEEDAELIPLCAIHSQDEEEQLLQRRAVVGCHLLASPMESDPLERRIAEVESLRSFAEAAFREDLHLEKAGIQGLPESIDTLQRVRRMYLQENSITQLPTSFCRLRTLKEVILADNGLTCLPEGFGNFPDLRLLRLERNPLTSLPESVSGMQKLRWLEMQGCLLETLPNGICQLASLEMLRVEDNRLSALPESFGDLQALRWLRCSNNRLTRLPGSFARLAALESMHAEDNLLAALPCSFGRLASLGTLDLENNALNSLPENFCQLKKLHSLRVNGNRLTEGLPWDFDTLEELKDFELGPLNTLRALWQQMFAKPGYV